MGDSPAYSNGNAALAPGSANGLDEMVVPANIADTIPIRSNLSDADTQANIQHAVSLNLPWFEASAPHDGRAIILAGGPSGAAYLGVIREAQMNGAVVFAPNGTMKMLNDHGVVPDYFVMLDGRPSSTRFIREGRAKHYLLSSQCDPSAFAALKDAKVTLWHSNYEGVRENIGDRPCALVGGGCTVGLQAMSIAFGMGFQNIDLYGFDSSYSGNVGHAYSMPENAGEPRFEYRVGGKVFVSAPWMVRQAMEFQISAQQMAEEGCVITVHGFGLLPEIARQMCNPPALTEKEKYESMWMHDAYRKVSPGELGVDLLLDTVVVSSGYRVIDFGCGTGRAGQLIQKRTGAEVVLVDFAENALDVGVHLPFEVRDLTRPIGLTGDIGFCADVMEHIPPSSVPTVIANIMACVQEAFFQISLTHDSCGVLIGHPLHMSVFPAGWWLEQFEDYDIIWSDHDDNTLTLHVSH